MADTASFTTNDRPVVTMHWFRRGLRLHDNPGLLASSQMRDVARFFPVYVLDGDSYQLRHCSALRANFLVECLQDLDRELRQRGSRLHCLDGDPIEILPKLWAKWNVTHMTWEQDETGEPYAKRRDERVMEKAKQCGVHVQVFASETLHPLQKYFDISPSPEAVPGTMGSFQTLFGRLGKVPLPVPAPERLPPAGEDLQSMLPPVRPTDLPWPRDIPKSEVTPLWGPADCRKLTPIVRGGERRALEQLEKTVTKRPDYVATFEKPKTSCTAIKEASTTVISPYLSMGCLSPRRVWHAVEESRRRSRAARQSKPPVSLHGQLLWRDFNHLMASSANRHWAGSWGQQQGNRYCRPIPWGDDPKLLDAWKEARTGYPWIDACMKQLELEGWIHHLGRHAVACFLTRGDLWQSWEKGALHFESQLLDADYSLNGFNWLWLSCSGFFYQYFRCYSPVAFQKKNDPNGLYIKKYLPILQKLPAKYIYEPWKAPFEVQQRAGVRIGKDYPKPIVDHAVVSKENMSKISCAYEVFKRVNNKQESSKDETKKRSSARGSGKRAPAKKKQKKLTDY